MRNPFNMGPLQNGDTVAIVGGGPGGTACAITLAREAALRGMELELVLFEGKNFGAHFNQCAGVLSPPIVSLLDDLVGVALPASLVQRSIRGYVLHSDTDSIRLHSETGGSADDDDEVSLAVRRVEFDRFMLEQVRSRGVRIVESRVTDLEFHENEVLVYSWSGTCRAKVVVGAFGLSRAMSATLAQYTGYRQPPRLQTVVSKIHPAELKPIPGLLNDDIHVLLPPLPRVEFAALIPKGNHVTVIVAGRSVTSEDVEQVLELPSVQALLSCAQKPEDYFKGTFPVGLAHRPFGDRYVTLGDSAGLVRPFKGKGINSALITGHLAATTMLRHGVSHQAFQHFWRDCHEFVGDIGYGRLVRRAANLVSHYCSLQPVVSLAKTDVDFRRTLYDCVSGRETYRRIILRSGNMGAAMRLAPQLLRSAMGSGR